MIYLQRRIGDHCQVGDGAHGSLPRVSEGIPYLTAKDIKEGRLTLHGAYRIDEGTFAKHFRCDSKALTLPLGGDVIFGIIGSLGQAYRVKSGDRFGLSSSIAMLRPDSGTLDPDYLYYWVTGPFFQQAIHAIKGGVAQSYISLEMIRSLPIAIPQISEQRRIATILSAYDNLIGNNTQRIAILEEMAQRIYVEWFVRFRFPGHEGVSTVESELGRVPEGWKKCCVEQLVAFAKGKKPPELFGTWAEGRVPALLIDALRGGAVAFTDAKHLVLAAESDTIMVMDGSGSGKVFIGHEGAIGSTLGRYRVAPDAPVGAYWLFLHFLTHQSEISAKNVGAAIPHANKDFIQSMPVVVPPCEVSAAFEGVVTPMFNLVKRLNAKNKILRTARDFLLPKLISGKLDVSKLFDAEFRPEGVAA